MFRFTSMASLCLLACAPLAQAQSLCSYFPSDSPTNGGATSHPLGEASTNTALRQQKMQWLFSTAELGGAARTISALAFAPRGVGRHSWGRLTVLMKHVAGPLGTDFVTNLGGGAHSALDDVFFDWSHGADDWYELGLVRPFRFDPTRGSLLLEIRVTNADFVGTDPSLHVDGARSVLHVSGYAGAPPRIGTFVTTAPKIRLCSSTAMLDELGLGCGTGPARLAGVGLPRLGAQVGLSLSGMNASASPSPAVIWFGVFFARSRFGPILQDCSLYTEFMIQVPIAVQGGSSGILPVPIPPEPLLIDGVVFAQAANLDPAANPAGVAITNYLRFVVGL